MKRIILLAVIGLSALHLHSQHITTFNLTFDHVALSVKEVDRSAEFYGNILKFREITNRSKMAGIRWFSLGEGKELHLISTVKENVTVNKAVHVALTTPDFDAFLAMIEKNHIPYSDWPGLVGKVNIRADGVKQIFFQDPDGYWIEVNSVAKQ